VLEEITEDTLPPLLQTQFLGRRLYAFGQCESTLLCARQLLKGASPAALHGALIVADYQTGGRGRNGHTWTSAKGLSLLFTLILDATHDAFASPMSVTFTAAVAVVEALRRQGIPHCNIKWPNDVLSPDGRKLCGILTESPSPHVLISGIGINVNQCAEDFPEELRNTVCSARMLAGQPLSRLALLADVLKELESNLELPHQAIIAKWQRLCNTLGRNVRVRVAGHDTFGQAVGLDEDGSLILRRMDGSLENVRSGEVEELRPCSIPPVFSS
jgi:BirA family transcriptional regulator, biotin operon repressor / biotin---[acetyl-CoA-carboxylase] ligase